MLTILACVVVMAAQAQTSFPRHQLGMSMFGGPQAAPKVEHVYGPVSDVRTKLGYTIGFGLSYKYAFDTSNSTYFGASGEVSWINPYVEAHIPALTLDDGRQVPAFDYDARWHIIGTIRQWTLLYGQRWPVRKGWIEGYAGAGIVEMTLTFLMNPLYQYHEDSVVFYGDIFTDYANNAQVAPTLRLGGSLYYPSTKRSAFNVGLVFLWSGRYVTGGYEILKGTSLASEGRFTGSMNYIAVQFGWAWTLGKMGSSPTSASLPPKLWRGSSVSAR
jgi:hypothetical protein